MAVKFSELAKKLNLTKLELQRRIRKLPFGNEVNIRTVMLPKKLAMKIEEAIAPKKEEKEPEKEEAKSEEVTKEATDKIHLPEVIKVKDFAATLKLPVTDVIAHLLKNGVTANINEYIDFETAAIIAGELGFTVDENLLIEKEEESDQPKKSANLKPRPAVVVVMGHVDHGKTTLLDKIRETNVVAGESGGITQHIAAYKVKVKSKEMVKEEEVTFLDTPGHSAFSMMRAHGARITDIAVLVVAADDGVKPQTLEAIEHAKASGVPIIVAINKIDAPGADTARVRKELSEAGIQTEDFGGKTPEVEISAKLNKNIDELLELILTEAALEELKADFTVPAKGVVVESSTGKAGATATALIQEGILRVGDAIVVGMVSGKVRAMEDSLGKRIKSAGPSDPVRVFGLSEVVRFGDSLEKVADEREARRVSLERRQKEGAKKISLATISEDIKRGKTKELNLVLKADVAGSLKAIKDSIEALSTEDVKVSIIDKGIGDVVENDIAQARASDAAVIGFKVKTDLAAKRLALQEKIKISTYDIIYKLIDDIAAALEGLLEPEIVEEEIGKGSILKVFKHGKKDKIIGLKVTSGKVEKNCLVRIKRKGEVLGEGVVKRIQHEKEETSEMKSGSEAGINLISDVPVEEGDRLEFYIKTEKLKKIKRKA